MDFKSLLKSLDQLNEAETTRTKTGLIHKGDYGREFDTDDEGNAVVKKEKSTEPKKRGAPVKADKPLTGKNDPKKQKVGDIFGRTTGEVPKGKKGMQHTPMKDADKEEKKAEKAEKKASLKDWIETVDSNMIAEAGLAVQPVGKPGQNFMIKDPANPTASAITTSNPAVVDAAKKGELSMQKPGATPSSTQVGAMKEDELDEKIEGGVKLNPEKKGMFDGKTKSELMSQYNKLKASGPHKLGSAENTKMKELAFAIRAKSGWGKVKEAEAPQNYAQSSPISNGGRSDTFLEGRAKADDKAEKAGKKVAKDLEYDMGHKGKDDNKAEKAGKKVTKDIEYDEKKKKKSVKESRDHHLKAAYHEGKAHGLSKQPYNCRHDDMEEARQYHEGYKCGLDECYGQMPILGRTAIGEMGPGSEVDDMASFGAHTPALDESSKPAVQIINDYDEVVMEFDSLPPRLRAALQGSDFGAVQWLADLSKHDEDIDMSTIEKMVFANGHVIEVQQYIDDLDEGNAFNKLGEMDKTSYMKQQAIKTPGSTFKAFGQTMRDSDVLDEFAFESLDNQLNSLLNEGLTVSISKGQQGAPDSVSVNAQDSEADMLLDIIKQAGLGVFGGEDKAVVDSPIGSRAIGGIEVVDDHDGMMSLMKKLSGQEQSSHDYEKEEGHGHDHAEHDHEICNECGMYECECPSDKEMVDEVESEDQMTYKMGEGAQNPPDNGSANSTNDEQGNAAANQALATADAEQNADTKQVNVSEGHTCEKCDCDPCKCETMSESSFFNLYKKLAILSEESTSEKDDKAEKAAKKVAKDIEYDEGHKGKDDDKAETAGKKVKKDIEYDDKKDKKLDEWANDAGPGKSVSDTTFEQDIDFMTKIISGGLNKQKSTGQTTIPVIAGQGKRTGVSESKMLNESVNDWKKLAGI
jgi:hypothetical protein